MKNVLIEKKKAHQHIIGKEFSEEYAVLKKEDMNVYVGHIIESLDPETYDYHQEEINAIYNLEDGTYSIEDGDFNYYITIKNEEEEMMKSLDKAIKDFNDWTRTALLVFDKEKKTFDTLVFGNDVQRTENVLNEGVYGVFSKSEIYGDKQITDERKEYIIDYVSLLLEGYDAGQAEYKLFDKYPFVR